LRLRRGGRWGPDRLVRYDEDDTTEEVEDDMAAWWHGGMDSDIHRCETHGVLVGDEKKIRRVFFVIVQQL
jgi:hypothetical protein